jgi:uncharacterized OB-fold protein
VPAVDPALVPFADLLPDVTDLSRPYWEGLAAGELRLQRCRACGAHQYPPESFCYACPSTDLEWVTVDGGGEVYSFIVVHQRYHPAFAEHLPYAVAAVQLDAGPRVLAALLFDEPGDVRVGARVRPRIERVAEDRAALFFTLDGAG